MVSIEAIKLVFWNLDYRRTTGSVSMWISIYSFTSCIPTADAMRASQWNRDFIGWSQSHSVKDVLCHVCSILKLKYSMFSWPKPMGLIFLCFPFVTHGSSEVMCLVISGQLPATIMSCYIYKSVHLFQHLFNQNQIKSESRTHNTFLCLYLII